MKVLALLSLLLGLFSAAPAWSEGQFIDVYPKSIDEVRKVLDTIDMNLDAVPDDGFEPILMMLHGPEAANFLRSNYAANQSIVDQTAKLSGYGVIEVKICETWMRKNKHDRDELFEFISTVKYGAGELRRLEKEEGYTEYTFDL